MKTNGGPPAGLYSSSDYVVEFDREANDTEARVKDFGANSASTGINLDKWVDAHVQRHWKFEGVCVTEDIPFKKCGGVETCQKTPWSSLSPDPKSEIGLINANGKLR